MMIAAPFLAFLPFILAVYLSSDSNSLDESTGLGALSWLTIFTIPLGIGVFIAGVVIALMD